MARGKKDQPKKENFWNVLRKIGPRLIRTLMRYAGTTSQTEFADQTGLTANQINRYYHGKEFPEENLAYLTGALGISEDSTWWLISQMMGEEYGYARFEIPQPGEVREPHTPYKLDRANERELPEDIAMIMALDLNRLEPNERIRFARERNALRDQSKTLRVLTEAYVERYQAALRRPRS